MNIINSSRDTTVWILRKYNNNYHSRIQPHVIIFASVNNNEVLKVFGLNPLISKKNLRKLQFTVKIY